MMGADSLPIVNGSGVHGGEDYQHWMDIRATHEKSSLQSHRHGGETFSNTLPVRKVAPVKPKNTLGKLRKLISAMQQAKHLPLHLTLCTLRKKEYKSYHWGSIFSKGTLL